MVRLVTISRRKTAVASYGEMLVMVGMATGLICVLCSIGMAQATEETQPANFASMTTEQADAFIKELRRTENNHLKRLLRISRLFLGVPYARDPDRSLRHQEGKSTGLLRFNPVDCTTFLEQTMAMARASGLQEAESILSNIQYINGTMDYSRRKHFMMAQWIPMNQEEGFIEDITCRVGKDAVRWVSKRLDPIAWERRSKKDRLPQLSSDQIPIGTFRLPIIPRDSIKQLADGIPPGTILNVVRVDFQRLPYRISHQGLVVIRRGRRYLRHAARSGYGRVVDELLGTFLRRNLAYSKWPVEGVNLQSIKAGRGDPDNDLPPQLN